MSKALSRVRALVSDIDSIQNQGRISSYVAPTQTVSHPLGAEMAGASVLPIQKTVEKAKAPAADPGKVLIQLTGNIAIQLQLDHTDELVEVRQLGESIEISFVDGKVIHLPLKGVA